MTGVMIERMAIPPNARKFSRILLDVSQEHDVPVADILGPSRQRRYAAARREALQRIHREHPKSSVNAIARIFNRDHTTICHYLGTLKRCEA
jgi:chromosomal replication initiation ATPase DnaA